MNTTSFFGQTAIVTGASGAVGQAIAARLLDRAATVCLLARSEESLHSLIAEKAWPPERALPYTVDLAEPAAVTRLCHELSRQHRSVHLLVHCAGTIAIHDVEQARIEDLDLQYQVNLRAPYQITQLLLPRIIACKGQVAFINSTAVLRPAKGAAQYAATKQGLRALADSLREEVNQHGVRVISVFMGRTASRMQAAVHEHEQRPYRPENLLQPDDVASILLYALELPRTAEVTELSIRPLIKSC